MNEPLRNKKYTHTSIQDKPLWTCYPELPSDKGFEPSSENFTLNSIPFGNFKARNLNITKR